MIRRTFLPLSVVYVPMVLVTFATNAGAGGFADDGTWMFDPGAVYTQSFEDFTPTPSPGTSAQSVDDPNALDGAKVLKASASYDTVFMEAPMPEGAGVWRVSAWIRTDAVVGVVVEGTSGAPGTFSQLYPTGRMTSDGWVEVESAPIATDGSAGSTAHVFFLGDQVIADAVEIRAAPDVAWEAATPCEGVVDPSCGANRLCFGGWCRDAGGWVPPMPQGEGRKQLADYLAHRLAYFFGPFDNRKQRLPLALAEIEGMRAAPSRWRFWQSFATAIHRLQDSHTSVFALADYVIENRRPLNACFVVGDADLTHQDAPADGTWPDILVSHVGDQASWGLGAGDRLIAIDGKHPLAWMKSSLTHDLAALEADDSSSTSLLAERMRLAIPRYARTITVIRCQGTSCGEPEDIDVATIPEMAPGESYDIDIVACDHRPGALVAGQPANHSYGLSALGGQVQGTDPTEKIYGLVWDYLVMQSAGANQISSAVQAWRADGRGVILDHRMGNGGQGAPGTTAAGDPIVSFARTSTFFGVELFRRAADEEGPATLQEGLDLVEQLKGSGLAWRAGSASAKTDVPIALLTARDVSFSDIFAYAMKGAPHVRIFGPHATNGAYNTFLGLSYGSGLSYQVSIGDTLATDGRSLCGHGVEPDEILLPKQSDLVLGKDTAIERALSWVRSEVTP